VRYQPKQVRLRGKLISSSDLEGLGPKLSDVYALTRAGDAVYQMFERTEEVPPKLRVLGDATSYPVRVFRSELWRTGDAQSSATLIRRWEHSVPVQSNESPEGPLRIDTRENLVPMLPPIPDRPSPP
jgi:hypothetical protein